MFNEILIGEVLLGLVIYCSLIVFNKRLCLILHYLHNTTKKGEFYEGYRF